jgi:mRNA-degrading endonuclease RelE of RelBE toxin-antitoxin system
MLTDPLQPTVDVRFTPEFKRNLRALAKRYRNIRADIEPVIEQLQCGHVIGDQIPRLGHTLYKVRIRNTDSRRGKSGGYRMIYYLRTQQSIVLITLYSKSDQADISANDVRQIIREFEKTVP